MLIQPIECTTPKVNTEVNYGLRVIMMYNEVSSLVKTKTKPKTFTILSSDIGNGAVGGREGYMGKLCTALQFVVSLKLIFKKCLQKPPQSHRIHVGYRNQLENRREKKFLTHNSNLKIQTSHKSINKNPTLQG